MTKNINVNVLILLVIATIFNLVLYVIYRDGLTLGAFVICFFLLSFFCIKTEIINTDKPPFFY